MNLGNTESKPQSRDRTSSTNRKSFKNKLKIPSGNTFFSLSLHQQ